MRLFPRLLIPGLGIVLCTISAAVFLVSHNTEFYRDEDYEYLSQAGNFAQIFLNIPRSLLDPQDLIYRLGTFVHAFLFYRHGPVPALYAGVFYAVASELGISMTVALYQLPTALLAIATVAMGYRVFLRAGVSTPLAFAGALLLCFSPLLAALGRGLHTWTWVWIPLGQILAVAALQRVAKDGSGHGWAAFAVVNALLGDGLFFLTLPALAVAFAVRKVEWSPRLGIAGALIRAIPGGVCPLLHRQVMVPVILALGAIIGSGIVVLALNGSFQQTVPLSSLSLLALSGHGGDSGALNLEPALWADYALVALGEGAPVLAVAVLAGLLWGRKPIKGLEWSFAIIAGLGFGVLFYILAPYHAGTVQTYQVYTLFPFILLSVLAVDRLGGNLRRGAVVAFSGVVGLAAISMLAFVWHVDLSFARQHFAAGDFGSNKPLFGTKAAGMLVRQILMASLKADIGSPILVDAWRGDGPTESQPYGGFRNWASPFIAFSGLAQRGDWYSHATGSPLTVTADYRFDGLPIRPTSLACTADLCVRIDRGGRCGPEHQVFRGEDLVASVWLCDGQNLPARRGQAAELGKLYDEQLNRLDDLVPDRPGYRRNWLIQRIRTLVSG